LIVGVPIEHLFFAPLKGLIKEAVFDVLILHYLGLMIVHNFSRIEKSFESTAKTTHQNSSGRRNISEGLDFFSIFKKQMSEFVLMLIY